MSLFKTQFNYILLVNAIVLHVFASYGFYLAISNQTNWKTIIYHLVLANLALLAGLMGAHRLWSHRSYEAHKVVEFILLVFETYSGQSPVYIWARDHRVHHKYVDTDADPYNVKRGLFFSQIGWFFMRKTKEFKEKVKTINLDDLHNDKMAMFQYRYYPILIYSLWMVSALVPHLLWKESLFNSLCVLMLSVTISLWHVGTINSLSHYWGWKPYDTGMEPTFSRLVAYLTFGEGYHNFHHTFPKDYTQSELHWSQNFNISALMIEMLEKVNMVKNTKLANKQIVALRRKRTGDLSIKIAPWSSILDQITGFIVVNWAIWLIFGIRHLRFA